MSNMLPTQVYLGFWRMYENLFFIQTKQWPRPLSVIWDVSPDSEPRGRTCIRNISTENSEGGRKADALHNAKALEESMKVGFLCSDAHRLRWRVKPGEGLVKRSSACLCLLPCSEDVMGLRTHNRWGERKLISDYLTWLPVITAALTFLPCAHDRDPPSNQRLMSTLAILGLTLDPVKCSDIWWKIKTDWKN